MSLSENLRDETFSGTKEVAENLKIEVSKLQPWIDAHVPGAGAIKKIEQFKGGQSNPTYRITTEGKDVLKKLIKTSLKEKNEIKNFLSEYVITIDDERGDGIVTYYFEDKIYKR